MKKPTMKFRNVIRILLDNDFQLDRQDGSHRHYEGVVDGIRRLVTISGRDGEEVGRKLLGYIKRQSGLPKKLFR